jgi:uncharacterized protein (TIGR03545 family)
MIRWSYLLPRVLIVAVLVAAYWFGLNPLARWVLVQTGQSLTKAKVDLGSAQVSLARAQVELVGLQVADPRRPLKNLLAADGLTLDLDTAALLRRRLIVEQACVSGLRVDTDRDESGALAPGDGLRLTLPGKELLASAGRQLAESGRQWLEQVAAGLQQDLTQEIERLETVRTVNDLVERWPRQCQELETQAQVLRTRVERLRERFAHPPTNPLEILESCRQLTAELESLQRDVEQLQRQCAQLPQQAERDQQAVVAAAGRDRDELRRRFRLDRLRPEQLSEYLLQRELGERVATVLQWVHWVSRQGTTADEPEPVRARGVDVLPAHPVEPDFLIRHLSAAGRVWCEGRPYDFLATLAGLTTQPKVLGAPTEIRARVKLPAELWVEATIDRSGAEPHDRIIVQCPAWAQAARTLGNVDQLALSISPGNTALGLDVQICGPRLSGRLRTVQEPVELTAVLGPRCGGTRVAGVLQTALSGVRRLEADVYLCGTVAQPQWRLESNLGVQLVAGLSTAVQRELETRGDQLYAAMQRKVEERLAVAQQTLVARQAQVHNQLLAAIAEARQMGTSLAQRVPMAQPILSGGLPSSLATGLPLRF